MKIWGQIMANIACVSTPPKSIKNKSPEVAATIKGAIDNISQMYGTNDSQANQGPKHLSFFLPRVIDLITQGAVLEGGVK